MSHKTFVQSSVLILILLSFLTIPVSVKAGGVCGGTYIVEQGQTVDSIAATCGTTASAIYAANPGLSGSLYTGQTLTVPSYSSQSNIGTTSSYSGYNPYNYNYAPVNSNGAYIVQYGDTFSGIASRFGVSMFALWAANPNIWDINLLYAGQVLYLPTSTGQANYYYASCSPCYSNVPTSTQKSTALSVGILPAGSPTGEISLSNRANNDVYVSLQGTTRDGIGFIREYPVKGTMNVNVPAGWYEYVAWVGDHAFSGQFNLPTDSNHSITFYSNRVVIK